MSIVETYQKCNKDFLPVAKKQHRILTQPSKATGNDGMDNAESNLICRVYDKLVSNKGNTSYTILESLGSGTFGQVFRCQKTGSKEFVAVKVIKNKPAYHTQGLIEVKSWNSSTKNLIRVTARALYVCWTHLRVKDTSA